MADEPPDPQENAEAERMEVADEFISRRLQIIPEAESQFAIEKTRR